MTEKYLPGSSIHIFVNLSQVVLWLKRICGIYEHLLIVSIGAKRLLRGPYKDIMETRLFIYSWHWRLPYLIPNTRMSTVMINVHWQLDWIYNPTGSAPLGMISQRITREGKTHLGYGWHTDWIEKRETRKSDESRVPSSLRGEQACLQYCCQSLESPRHDGLYPLELRAKVNPPFSCFLEWVWSQWQGQTTSQCRVISIAAGCQ